MSKVKRNKRARKAVTLLLSLAGLVVLSLGIVNLYEMINELEFATLPKAGESETENSGEEAGSTEQPLPKKLFEEYYGKAAEILDGMTLEDKVGQLFLVRCPKKDAIGAIRQYKLGGFVLFANDFENLTAAETIEKLADFQAESNTPMILAVDEEGGTVVRVSKNPRLASEGFKSPQQLYKEGGLEAIRQDAVNKSDRLKRLGINLNLAPVADVSTNPDDYIYQRTFGKSALETADYITCLVNAMNGQKLSCTLKHFPGYGNNANTHEQIAIDKRPYSAFTGSDFLPFSAGIKAGAESVMVSHNVVLSIDEALPASLSPKMHEILRKELQFSGVIMTDDLSMEGVKLFVGNESPALLALKAGNDLLVVSDFQEEYQKVLSAAMNEEISKEMIEGAVLKILAWKYSMGLFPET